MPSRITSKHGPMFPYSFSLDLSARFKGNGPKDVPLGDCFCRWTLDNPDRALAWNDQGKGKGVTILPSDGPGRCCSDRTPQLFLRSCVTDDVDQPVSGPGKIYRAYIAGHGWYAANPGTDYFVRLVTNKYDVPLLREEAVMYDQEPPGVRREPLREKSRNGEEPLAFHGFFQTDARDAAAIVFEFNITSLRDEIKDKKPRKKKQKRCNNSNAPGETKPGETNSQGCMSCS